MVKDGTLVLCPLLLAFKLSIACLRLTVPIFAVTLVGFGYTACMILELWFEVEADEHTLER